MNESNNTSLTVTSTQRTPEEQVEAMFNNIKNKGKDNQLKLYKSPGQAVINCFPSKEAVLKKVYEVGPQKVSKHCADKNVLNVIDIAPSSLDNPKDFSNSLSRHIKVEKVLSPYNSKDPAIHVEIRQ